MFGSTSNSLTRKTATNSDRNDQSPVATQNEITRSVLESLGLTGSLTDAEYHCLIGIPPRDHDREIIFRWIYNLANSNGNAAIPLSSYGLNVTEQGDVRSVCAPDAPCLEFNALLGGPLEAIAAECEFLDKFLRVVAETPLLQFIEDANPCQESGELACLIEATCAGDGQ